MINRVLSWDGCTNSRDLGGLRTATGRVTRRRAFIRSDSPARLTAAGWSALYSYGIRTISIYPKIILSKTWAQAM